MSDLQITPPLPVASLTGAAATPSALPGATGESFLATLKDAMDKVTQAESRADGSVQSLLTGQTANIHETMIALQKADVSFQLMLQVRNKIVGAYEEIMRMQL